MTSETPQWCTSSFSDNGGACVEVALNLAAPCGLIPVRDSKLPGSPVLRIPAVAFSSFVAGVKAGPSGAV